MSQTPRHVLTTQHAAPRCPQHCPRAAGFGTDHPGTGRCRQHELEAARLAAAGPIPLMTFREARYDDGLSYHETAGGEPSQGWEDRDEAA
ncbi:hypothetical protein ACFVY4_26875 [Streptomyces sp. NPDC058299]|uniref:hypothetical protein n=1 Tax=Streptomyces sp. NPDC058299 TaxID=3346435 RepID=UPI0036EFD416